MKLFLLSVFLYIIHFEAVEACPKGYISTEGHNGLCCKPVTCPQTDHFIQPCQRHFGNDTCMPCPVGSYLEDYATSEFIVACFQYDCPEDTVPQRHRSTEQCSKHCRCNLNKGYCGHDACNCRYMECDFGETLRQDCGCQPMSSEINRIQESTPQEKKIIKNVSTTAISDNKISTMKTVIEDVDMATTKVETPSYDGKTGFKGWIIVIVVVVCATVFIVLVIYIKGSKVFSNKYHIMNISGKYATVTAGDNAATTVVNQETNSVYSEDRNSSEFNGFVY